MADISINAQSSIRLGGSKVIYFDPFMVTNEKHDADIIFITHSHHDHFSLEDILKVAKYDTLFVAPESMRSDIKKTKSLSFDKFTFADAKDAGAKSDSVGGINFSWVRAYNVGKLFHTKGSDWLGYIVDLDGTSYYVTGDTDENADNLKAKCDVLFVPCGGKFTFKPEEAASFAAKISPKLAIPTHYGSIVGTPDDGKIFADKLKELAPEIETKIIM